MIFSNEKTQCEGHTRLLFSAWTVIYSLGDRQQEIRVVFVNRYLVATSSVLLLV